MGAMPYQQCFGQKLHTNYKDNKMRKFTVKTIMMAEPNKSMFLAKGKVHEMIMSVEHADSFRKQMADFVNDLSVEIEAHHDVIISLNKRIEELEHREEDKLNKRKFKVVEEAKFRMKFPNFEFSKSYSKGDKVEFNGLDYLYKENFPSTGMTPGLGSVYWTKVI